MIRVIVAGIAGRMGQLIAARIHQDAALKLAGGFEHNASPALGKDIGEVIGAGRMNIPVAGALVDIIDQGDVIVDFTSPESTMENLKVALQAKKKIIIGTTGLSKKDQTTIAKAGNSIAVVFAPNMSIGVNLLFKLSQLVAGVLGEEYDVEIVEAHHKFKKDAPSGTAKELVRQVAAGRKINADEDVIYGREGMCGERKKGIIGVHAVRGGDVFGEHTVSFMAAGERIELVHRASSRDAFVKGALIAAHFIGKKEKGLFTMQDILGLK